METTKQNTFKAPYISPVLTKHEILRDITAASSGSGVVRERIEGVVCRLFPRLPGCD